MYVINLRNLSLKDIKSAGGKGAILGEMMQAGFPVPDGFVITTDAYQKFHNGKLSNILNSEIEEAFDSLKVKRIAVRSSAIAEDSTTASWAGQLESELNITQENLFESIKKCWASMQSERAINYAKQKNIQLNQLSVAVVIQKMIDSEKSGVMFTINPTTNDSNEIVIDAGYGLGELIAQGEITPDNYIVDKKTNKSRSKNLGNQQVMLIYQHGKNRKIKVPAILKNNFILHEEQINELVHLGIKIENHYRKPQDIEWAIENGKYYILQARPVTTF